MFSQVCICPQEGVSQHALQVVYQHALQQVLRGVVSQHALQVSRPTLKGKSRWIWVGVGEGIQAHTQGAS